MRSNGFSALEPFFANITLHRVADGMFSLDMLNQCAIATKSLTTMLAYCILDYAVIVSQMFVQISEQPNIRAMRAVEPLVFQSTMCNQSILRLEFLALSIDWTAMHVCFITLFCFDVNRWFNVFSTIENSKLIENLMEITKLIILDCLSHFYLCYNWLRPRFWFHLFICQSFRVAIALCFEIFGLDICKIKKWSAFMMAVETGLHHYLLGGMFSWQSFFCIWLSLSSFLISPSICSTTSGSIFMMVVWISSMCW